MKSGKVLLGFVTLAVFLMTSPAVMAENYLMAGGYDAPDDKSSTRQDTKSKKSLDEIRESLKAREADDMSSATPVVYKAPSDRKLDKDFFLNPDWGIPLTYKQLYETAGYIDDGNSEIFGEISDAKKTTQTSFTTPDTMYINRGLKDGVKPGDQFYVLHMGAEQVRHPVTNEYVGRKIIIDGIVEVTKALDDDSQVVIIESFDGVEKGEKIVRRSNLEPPIIDPDKPVLIKNIEGYLIASRNVAKGFSAGDVVYLDVGKNVGVEPGDVFNVIDSEPVVRQDGSVVDGFSKTKGLAKVITTREKTSTAFIFSSEDVMMAGDRVRFSPER